MVKLYKDSELTDPWDENSDLMPEHDLILYTTGVPLFAYEGVTLIQDSETVTGLMLTAYHGRGGSDRYDFPGQSLCEAYF